MGMAITITPLLPNPKMTKNRLFIFLIIFSPLAFGTVEPWSYAVMEILTFFALAMLLITGAKNQETLLAVPGIIPLLLFLVYIIIQIIPLPPAVVKFFSPAAYNLHSAAIALSAPDAWMTFSIHPANTLKEFFRWATYAAFYVLTIQLLRRHDRIKKTVVAVTIFGALLSFSSILQFYLTDDMALWFRHVPKNSLIVGPYICHNHYAGLMEMIFPVVLALFFFHRPRARSTSLLKGVVEILSQEKANIHILIGMAALLIATSVFVSLSRGGMLSLCLSLVFFTYLLLKRKISRSNTILITAIIVLTALSVGWFGWGKIFERFASLKKVDGTIYEARLDFWKDTVKIVKDFPVTGTGMGTYGDIYPSYQSGFGNLTVDHAHNDYLELAAEGGGIGFVLAAAFIIVFFVKTYRTFLTRGDAYSLYISMGSMTGVIALLIHALTDFNFYVGANGLWFFFLAGLAVSASNTTMRDGARSSRLEPVRSQRVKIASVIVICVMMVAVTVYHMAVLTGNFYFSHISHYRAGAKTQKEDLQKIKRIVEYASIFNPLNSVYSFASANASLFLNDEISAMRDFKKAIRLNPANSGYLKRLGDIFAKKGARDLAEKLLFASVVRDISNADNALEYGAWLLANNKTALGLAYVKRAVEIEKRKIDSALTTMAIYNVSDEDMLEAVPKIPGAVMAYADFLYGSGKRQEAENQYLAALSFIEKQETISRWEFYRVYDFFKKRGNDKDALKVMKRASEVLPRDAGIRISLGDLYQNMGITYRAQEEYQQAVFIDPDNQTAKRRLKALKPVNP